MKRLFLFSFLLLGALKFSIFDFPFSIGEAKACTNLIVGKKASKDGSVIVSYSCDDYGAYGYMNFLPGGKHKKGEMRALYHYESNNYLGEIPEAEETLPFMRPPMAVVRNSVILPLVCSIMAV